MRAIKLILFHILLSLRKPILVVSKLLALLFFSGLAMTMCIEELSAVTLLPKVMMAMLGVTFTLIYWLYDYLIFYFKPKMLDIILVA